MISLIILRNLHFIKLADNQNIYLPEVSETLCESMCEKGVSFCDLFAR